MQYTIRYRQHEIDVSTIARLEGFAWQILVDGTIQDTSRELVGSEAQAFDDAHAAGKAWIDQLLQSE
jgi:hypothetical protein